MAPITVVELRSLMLKQIALAGFASFTVAAFPVVSKALTVQEVPNPRQVNGGWVTDMADMLSPATEAQLNQIISDLEAKNSSEIAVVTVPETSPSATPKAFATALFNYWGIGKKGRDNGVLLLISQRERRVEIETGYSIESILPDARVSKIIQQEIAPRFKQGDFNGGTLAGTQALIVELKAGELPTNAAANQQNPNMGIPWEVFAIAGVVVVAIAICGGVLVLIIRRLVNWLNRPVLIEPEGRSRSYKLWGGEKQLRCAHCQQPMQKLDPVLVLPHLTPAEQVAQNLGSVEFEGWQCPKCHPHLTGMGIHIRAYVATINKFSNCPICQELTVERTDRILQSPTIYSEGIRQITHKCHCCFDCRETEEIIPSLTPPRPTTPNISVRSSSNLYTVSNDSYSNFSSDTNTSSYSTGNYDSSSDNTSNSSSCDNSSNSWSSDSGSSNSSSDFGGGSSGGGGAGSDW
ncbi:MULTISPECIES: TPM domain-containing protein [unclassified Coleofasciculus]|uniref:TPM domain-containing protein n=1 Tax=Cyanophyceae TaxID=3028117 RepID=UPI0018F0383C|nr:MULTISPECIES: TPM domain-containing protein [unclassified Coleofasciculus]